MLTKIIADEIKRTLDDFDENKMYKKMLNHYRILNLIDEEKNWKTSELQEISSILLPTDMTEKKSKEFIDEMAQLADKNPYLVRFLKKIENENFEDLAQKVKIEGPRVFPDIVALSFVLQNLTQAMYKDPKILESCVGVFEKTRQKANSVQYQSLFHKIKLLSVEYPIKKLFIKCHKKGSVPKNSGAFPLMLNILEASIQDYLNKFKENCETGWTLAMNRVGRKNSASKTGAGPSCWSVDKKAISMSPPLPLEWANLYQTWNMAFVSNMKDFPYIIPKLFIPQVASYQEKPEEYMYNRVLALYILVNHAAFNYGEKQKKKEAVIQWNDEKLTRLWGESNAESAVEYKTEILRREKA